MIRKVIVQVGRTDANNSAGHRVKIQHSIYRRVRNSREYGSPFYAIELQYDQSGDACS
jgi:hypothetical protein